MFTISQNKKKYFFGSPLWGLKGILLLIPWENARLLLLLNPASRSGTKCHREMMWVPTMFQQRPCMREHCGTLHSSSRWSRHAVLSCRRSKDEIFSAHQVPAGHQHAYYPQCSGLINTSPHIVSSSQLRMQIGCLLMYRWWNRNAPQRELLFVHCMIRELHLLAVRRIINSIFLTSGLASFNFLANWNQLTCDAQIQLWQMLNRMSRSLWEDKQQKSVPHLLSHKTLKSKVANFPSFIFSRRHMLAMRKIFVVQGEIKMQRHEWDVGDTSGF